MNVCSLTRIHFGSVVFLYNTAIIDKLSLGHKSSVMLCLLVEILQMDSPSKQKILIFK